MKKFSGFITVLILTALPLGFVYAQAGHTLHTKDFASEQVIELSLPSALTKVRLSLKSGLVVEGTLLERNDQFVLVRAQKVEMRFYFDEIKELQTWQTNAP